MKKTIIALSALSVAALFSAPASADCASVTVNAPGGQIDGVVQCDLPDLDNLNNLLNNGGLTNADGISSQGSTFSNTTGSTFSQGFVSTADGLNNSQIQSFGLSETSALAEAEAVGRQTLSAGSETGLTGVNLSTDSRSLSGSMVNGTGFASNSTGGSATSDGGASLSHSGSATLSRGTIY